MEGGDFCGTKVNYNRLTFGVHVPNLGTFYLLYLHTTTKFHTMRIIVERRNLLRDIMMENRMKRNKGVYDKSKEEIEDKCLEHLYPEADIIDVTSKSKSELQRMSPLYPHGDIPVPNSPGWRASCVESVWQGLKVFDAAQALRHGTAGFSFIGDGKRGVIDAKGNETVE